MDPDLILRWLHIIGACVLLGTGAGIAFFMLAAHRSRDPRFIAQTASTVVLADFLFTTTAVVLQPITGALLAWRLGWSFSEGWIALSLALYAMAGLFWLPVVWIQIKMRGLARLAAENEAPLPALYHRLFRIWFASGFPAFAAVLAIIWLMIARPAIGWG
ncbi:DUF2269 domain-containing protein [Ruegeria lacuscaerulensis]|uniref:DUF2269 family protein n=1 Tax=Ruegeria lacuscaerulensis TaxID=55218 RepID=UPI001F36205A|nr:DUF2269 domain-containing protein [Ruegeria lacuscaerulensis]